MIPTSTKEIVEEIPEGRAENLVVQTSEIGLNNRRDRYLQVTVLAE